MKRFYQSTGGKIILFLICLFSIAGAAASLLAGLYILDNDYNVYTSTDRQIFASKMKKQLFYEGENFLYGLKDPEADKQTVTPRDYDSNVVFEVLDHKDRLIYAIDPELEIDEESVRTFTYEVTFEDGRVILVQTKEDILLDGEWIHHSPVGYETIGVFEHDQNAKMITRTYTVTVGLIKGLPLNDGYNYLWYKIHFFYSIRYVILVLGTASLLLGLISFILLLLGAGHVADKDELVPDLLYSIPWDLMACIWGIVALPICLLIGKFFRTDYLSAGVVFLAGTLIAVPTGIGLCICLASRLKQHTLWKTSLLGKCWRLFWNLVKKCINLLKQLLLNMPLVWRTGLVLLVISALELLALFLARWDPDNYVILWFLEKCLLIPLILLFVLNLRRLEKGAKALAEGNLSYHTETENLFPGVRKSADHLNQIGLGMSRAVEERLKSERMKTELITNVSHDIKTPLTSVINYANLINEEREHPEKVEEYAEVLIRQSDRLKRLLEDLVEASKASTGNLDVDMLPCSASVFLDQIAGEYEEKIRQADLSLVQKLPEKDLIILADGRRMWRLFSNLINNICKYSLPGSRVYLTLEEQDGKAVFSFKNTSREPLNLSEEELLERFTRGDASRHTEGSGLGLSIAKSMADLQGGNLRLTTDGDLFKAVVEFPIVETK